MAHSNQFIRVVVAAAILLLAAACSRLPSISTGGDVTALYAPPETYADHRAQQQTFVVDGLSLAYTDHGEGPAIVLLHGVPTSSWMYRKVIPGLQTNFRVISVDLIGFGSSDKPEGEAAYGEALQAERVRLLLGELGVDQYALLLHDMGGLVAWEIMRTAPEDVTHALILNTIVGDVGFNQPNMKPGAMTRQLMNAYSSGLTSSAVLTKTFNDLGLTGEHKLTEEECFGYVLPMREGANPALYSFFTSINEQMFESLDEQWTALKTWNGEAFVMWGAEDETLTTNQIPMLKETLSIPEENIAIYWDNGHFLAEEIPDEIVRNAEAFIRG
ncbi:MAG: alpha/beta hydrolase [Pseudomonadota bacterium]